MSLSEHYDSPPDWSVRTPRVAMVVPEYYPSFTGHGIYLRRLLQTLGGSIGALVIAGNPDGTLPDQDLVDGVRVIRFRYRSGGRGQDVRFAFACAAALFQLRRSYDIVHLHGLWDRYYVLALLSKILRKRIVLQMVLLGSDDPVSFAASCRAGKVRLRAQRWLNGFVSISSSISERYRAAGLPAEKLHEIVQGVDLFRFSPPTERHKLSIRRRLGLRSGDRIALFVGAVIERKGVDILIDAWRTIGLPNSAYELVLVGPNEFVGKEPEAERLRRYARKIQDQVNRDNLRVRFVGPRDDVESFFKAADVFVLPSRKEGFGNVIIEAMASGIPCIVTPMDGVAFETVTDGVDGFIRSRPEEIAKCLRILLDDSRLARSMGRRGRTRVSERFDLKVIAKRYLELYRRIRDEDGTMPACDTLGARSAGCRAKDPYTAEEVEMPSKPYGG